MVEPESLKISLIRRLEIIQKLQNDQDAQAITLALCAKDPVFWFNTFCWTYDPRSPAEGKPAYLPFDLFPRQVELIHWLEERVTASQEGLVEKSRDVGWTWVAAGFALHKWLFSPGFKTTFGSRKEVYVDRIGDPDSIFGKMRLILDRLPHWMLPAGFSRIDHDNFMRLLNPVNGNAITGEAGDNCGRGGRAQPLDAKLLTPTGWICMGDVKPGMQVIGANGKPTKVTGVFPQGVKEIYRVTFSDGALTECCDDHLWRVTTRSIRKSINNHHCWPRTPRFAVLSTSELKTTLLVKRKDTQREYQYQIPVIAPVTFKRKKSLPLDPYLLGALLGDGSISNIDRTAPAFTTADSEMIELLQARLPATCKMTKGSAYEWRISEQRSKKGSRLYNPVKKGLKALGVAGHLSYTKFIPNAYKFGSPETRLEILRGLLDTDGWVTTRGKNQNGSKVNFCSVSRRLAEDVRFIVQSLGGTATISTRSGNRRTFPGGRTYDCVESHQLIIAMPRGMNPFRMKRKAERYRERLKYRSSRSIISIEPIGHKEAQCITVDAKNNLYVTDDCIVTHNSSLYVIDEGAFIEHAEKVDAAIVANANTRIWASSVNGAGNLFFRKRYSGNIPVFRFHYTDDPRKDDAWAEKKKKEVEPTTWASEYDIDYAASLEGVCIPAKWVESSRRLAEAWARKPHGQGTAGLDVGAGRAKSVLVPKFGPVVLMPHAWQEVDNIQTTYRSLDTARELGVTRIHYDAVGVGNTVTSTLNHANTEGLTVTGINTGNPPSDAIMPDGRDAKEWFANLKAEIWWKMRDAFKATHEHVLYLEDHPDGVPHPEADLILLPNDSDLIGQISLVRWFRNEKGRIIMESKKQLAQRGIPSPDYAEALVLNFAPESAGLVLGTL